MAFLNDDVRCPPMLELEEPKGTKMAPVRELPYRTLRKEFLHEQNKPVVKTWIPLL